MPATGSSMTAPRSIHVRLSPHPRGRVPGGYAIEAEVACAGAGRLALTYRLTGDPELLRIPAARPAERVDELWRHTCFEVFLRASGEAYREYNLSPSGQWQAYDFAGYRRGGGVAPAPAPDIACQCRENALLLRTTLDCPGAPRPLSIGLCAVLEHSDGELSHWACRHPPGKPDFHSPSAFALSLRCVPGRHETP